MANRSFGGARWRKNLTAPNATSPPIEILPLATAYSTGLWRGDFVKLASTGYIQAAAAGNTLYGIFDGIERYYDGTVMRPAAYHVASAGSYSTNFERQTMARIIPLFGQVFEMCTDEVSSTYDTYAEHLAFVGENCEFVAADGTGDTSGNLLDISTHATTSTLSLRMHGISRQVDEDFAAAGVHWFLTANLVQQPTAGSSTGT